LSLLGEQGFIIKSLSTKHCFCRALFIKPPMGLILHGQPKNLNQLFVSTVAFYYYGSYSAWYIFYSLIGPCRPIPSCYYLAHKGRAFFKAILLRIAELSLKLFGAFGSYTVDGQ